VFFADEPTAVAAGYRPCAVCLPEAYRTWKHRTRTATVNERRSSTRGERHMSPLENARPETRLPAADLERARRWYHDKLGLTPTEERDGGLMYRLAGGVFCLFRSQGRSEGTFTQLALNVDDIDAVVAELRSRGVEFERLDIPGFTTVNDIVEVSGNYPSKGTRERGAFFRDSEGNMIALGQSLS
jgi:catechol 2,3-dioxygenase-like lactoylglutathione lyase family enzyme